MLDARRRLRLGRVLRVRELEAVAACTITFATAATESGATVSPASPLSTFMSAPLLKSLLLLSDGGGAGGAGGWGSCNGSPPIIDTPSSLMFSRCCFGCFGCCCCSCCSCWAWCCIRGGENSCEEMATCGSPSVTRSCSIPVATSCMGMGWLRATCAGRSGEDEARV